MLFKTKTLVDELVLERKKFATKTDILEEVKAILEQNELERSSIRLTLKEKSSTNYNNFEFDLVETENIFHINQIQKIAIDFRLRFLDSNLFANEIPEEAISKISKLEKLHNTKLEGFKIMAPSKTFKLDNYDDPLLFAPIGNNYYYLIHQWGKDLVWYRKLLVLPFRTMFNFVIFCGIVSLLITSATPLDNLGKTVPLAPIILFLFMFKAVIASSAYYFFLMGKNFNSEIWDRKFKEN